MHALPLLTISLLLLGAGARAATEPAVARGEYLATAAGCSSCHTDSENDGLPYAGGHSLDSPYGTFVVPNITPDTATGIGGWTDAEFLAAVRDGVSPAGEHYYPAFPYASYAGMTERDVLDIKAYLDSLPAVERPNEPHDLAWYLPGRWAMPVWQRMFAPWDYPEPPESAADDAEWQRGAYLVRHLGHCGECHTPRDRFGALLVEQELAGSPKDAAGGGAPNIMATADGIGGWDTADLLLFFQIGMMRDGDFAGGAMSEVIDNTSALTEADQQAMARYLQSVK